MENMHRELIYDEDQIIEDGRSILADGCILKTRKGSDNLFESYQILCIRYL